MITFEKKRERDFKVLNLTDPQVQLDEWDTVGKVFIDTVRELTDRCSPDLITVSGDITSTDVPEAYEKFSAVMDSFGIPWAPVWGNHDNQLGEEYTKKIAEIVKNAKLSVFEDGDERLGNGNYFIEINEESVPVAALAMMDTHDTVEAEVDGEMRRSWAPLEKCQLDWFREEAEKLKERGCRDITVVIHIPTHAYGEAFEEALEPDMIENMARPREVSPERWRDGYKDTVGVFPERPSCYVKDDGAHDAFLETGITRRVIAGHNHLDNCILNYRGLQLIYALKTGIGSYHDKRLNGGTLLTVGGDGTVDVHHEFVSID